MKAFLAVIVAAIVASSAAINEPVASPTAAIERELAEYERQLGTDITGTPTRGGKPPTRPSMSYDSYGGSYGPVDHAKAGKHSKGGKASSSEPSSMSYGGSYGPVDHAKAGKHSKVEEPSSVSMSYGPPPATKAAKHSKAGKASSSMSHSYGSHDYTYGRQ